MQLSCLIGKSSRYLHKEWGFPFNDSLLILRLISAESYLTSRTSPHFSQTMAFWFKEYEAPQALHVRLSANIFDAWAKNSIKHISVRASELLKCLHGFCRWCSVCPVQMNRWNGEWMIDSFQASFLWLPGLFTKQRPIQPRKFSLIAIAVWWSQVTSCWWHWRNINFPCEPFFGFSCTLFRVQRRTCPTSDRDVEEVLPWWRWGSSSTWLWSVSRAWYC